MLTTLLISGCEDGIIILDSNSSGQCIIQCKEQMEDRNCISSVPSFHEIILNGEIKEQSCECTVLNCIFG